MNISRSSERPKSIPVIGLTGYLGAGKTSLLNHVLRQPGARIGVVVNDFGEVNVDAGLVTGQVDEPASISGGCLCCVTSTDELDAALTRLSDVRLNLDAIVVEASGLADPMALARLIYFSDVDRIRYGGMVDVVDVVRHPATVDIGNLPPLRYAAASLVVVNKLDQLPPDERERAVERIALRVLERNPRAQVIGAVGGRIDPGLLFDVAVDEDEPAQLPIRQLLLAGDGHPHDHLHAEAVTVQTDHTVDPGLVVDLLEQPPVGVYRLKGTVAVRPRSVVRSYVVNVVGSSVHVAAARAGGAPARASTLVAIGANFDRDEVQKRLRVALRPAAGAAEAAGFGRLQRYRRLSL